MYTNKKDLEICGLFRRFSAYIVDFFILVIPTFIIHSIVMTFPNTVKGITMLTDIFLNCSYYGYFLSSHKQASIGQILLGMRVIKTDGTKLSFMCSFDRSLVQFLLPTVMSGITKWQEISNSTSPIYYMIIYCSTIFYISWYILALFSDKKQTFHDILYSTIVVKR